MVEQVYIDLKREDTRLRDWNRTSTEAPDTYFFLEKRRYSITRLKRLVWPTRPNGIIFLKREDTRLRDWNETPELLPAINRYDLKREDTRLRDWNDYDNHTEPPLFLKELEKRRYSITRLKHNRVEVVPSGPRPWKEKILDYEIETRVMCISTCCPVTNLKREDTRLRDWNCRIHTTTHLTLEILEKRRYSITRLKQECGMWDRHSGWLPLKREDTRLRDWNGASELTTNVACWSWKEKILDYEIETWLLQVVVQMSHSLEKRRYSITRLKRNLAMRNGLTARTWKEKILDYEIETCIASCVSRGRVSLEKRRYSITRLKP